MKPIVFAPEAQAEFEAAVEWYEAKAVGLGERSYCTLTMYCNLSRRPPPAFPNGT